MKSLLLYAPAPLFALAACTSPAPETAVMPPSPPRETVSSTLFTPTPTPLPARTLPEGFEMTLEGASVEYGDLSPRPPDRESPTIVVTAPASAPFHQVSRVLDHVHELGYRVSFTVGD